MRVAPIIVLLCSNMFLFFQCYPGDSACQHPSIFNEAQSLAANAGSIEIMRPRVGYLYISNREITPTVMGKTIILGRITIFIDAYDVYPLKQVDIAIDNHLSYSSPMSPYFWTWNTRDYSFGVHELKATATNFIDVEFSCAMDVTVLSLRRGI